jgi:hypothetical protein
MTGAELDRIAARGARAVRDVAAATADPDGDLAAIYSGAVALEVPKPPGRRFLGWRAAAAAAVLVVVAALAFVWRNSDDGTRLVPATLPAPTPSVAPPSSPASATTTTSSPTSTTVGEPTSTLGVGRTSPLDVTGTCELSQCPEVGYAADGLPVAYHFGSKVMTVLEPTPRPMTLNIPESQGRLLGVGPDHVAYLLVETDEPLLAERSGRVLGVPTQGVQAGVVHEVVPPSSDLVLGGVAPTRLGIEVFDCCADDVTDAVYPYVDANGTPLPDDPTLAQWSWAFDGNRKIIHDNASGQDHEVPVEWPTSERTPTGDLRPLLDGRIVEVVPDELGSLTAWVLDPDGGTWTSTELGDVLVEDVDPAGAVLTRNRTTLSYGLVPLDE